MGFPKLFFYKDNYKKSNVKWFDLKEVVDQKPKFLALIQQNIKVDGKFVDYKFVYSSKHNYFKLITKEEENKNFFLNKLSIFKSKISVPEEIDDKNISEKEFIESILDHCTYSQIRNVKDPETKKRIVFKKFDQCKVKFLNKKNMNSLTLEQFTKLENEKTVKNQKKSMETKKSIKESKKQRSIITDKNFMLSLKWEKLPYLAISTLKMTNKNVGVININFHETKDECVGALVLNNNEGTWSINCPDNTDRKDGFKTKLAASGSISIESKNLIGVGYDTNNNMVKFLSNIEYLNE